MPKIFAEGLDMHAMSAAGIFGLDYYQMEKAGEYDRINGEWGNKKASYDFTHKCWFCKGDRGYDEPLTKEQLPGFVLDANSLSIKEMRDCYA